MVRDVQQERERKKKYQKETERKRCITEEEEDVPGGLGVKNPPANSGATGLSLAQEDPTCSKATEPAHLEPTL